jgi:hypothetical protein
VGHALQTRHAVDSRLLILQACRIARLPENNFHSPIPNRELP